MRSYRLKNLDKQANKNCATIYKIKNENLDNKWITLWIII